MAHVLASDTTHSPEAPPPYPGAAPDSERAKQPPLPQPPYKPYAKDIPDPPYEPYKGVQAFAPQP